jgi:hypothetical protein
MANEQNLIPFNKRSREDAERIRRMGAETFTRKSNHEIADICDELAGKYPKDFQWTG